YLALSKEIGIFRDMEVTSNDLANMTSTAYHDSKLLFKDFLVEGNKKEGKVAFANDIATYRNTEQGTMQTTGNPLDVAISGKGYFAIQTPLGERYTRNGNFKTDSTGNLVTSDGYPVLDETGQKIIFDEADKVIEIRDNGSVNVDNAERAKLKVVEFDNEQLLQRVGNSFYKSDVAPKDAENFTLASGMLERSNVQPFNSLTHLMYVSRSASDTANFISTVHALKRKASDTLAKLY
ncbi:MAG: flagellar hook-basal body complex protein, partial [Pseudomonadota bacterium]